MQKYNKIMKHTNICNKNEKKIATFTQNGTRLQLVQIVKMYYTPEGEIFNTEVIYQVRLNRKIVDTSISEYTERKIFATYCQNIVLQLKIY